MAPIDSKLAPSPIRRARRYWGAVSQRQTSAKKGNPRRESYRALSRSRREMIKRASYIRFLPIRHNYRAPVVNRRGLAGRCATRRHLAFDGSKTEETCVCARAKCPTGDRAGVRSYRRASERESIVAYASQTRATRRPRGRPGERGSLALSAQGRVPRIRVSRLAARPES